MCIRDRAVLPLRGKILNVERQQRNLTKVFSNEQIQRMIRALGAGVGNEEEDEGAFDPEKLRYGKIIIMTDADIDGAHIRTLILTFMWRFMRRAIVNGNVYSSPSVILNLKRFADRVGPQRKRQGFSGQEDAKGSSIVQDRCSEIQGSRRDEPRAVVADHDGS